MGRAQKRRHAAEKAAAYQARGLQEGWWQVEGPWPAEEPVEGQAQADEQMEEATEEAIPTAGLLFFCLRGESWYSGFALSLLGSLQICKSAFIWLLVAAELFVCVCEARAVFVWLCLHIVIWVLSTVQMCKYAFVVLSGCS